MKEALEITDYEDEFYNGGMGYEQACEMIDKFMKTIRPQRPAEPSKGHQRDSNI